MGAQHRRVDPGGARRHHIGDEALLPRLILARDHRDLRNALVAHQRRLDLARLDAEAAQLDLMVGPAEELEDAVGPPACEVPGPVHPAAGRPERIGNEALGGQAGTVEVAARETKTRNVELTPDTRRDRLQPTIQNINTRVPDRTTYRDTVERVDHHEHDQERDCIDCSFGWAVKIFELDRHQVRQGFEILHSLALIELHHCR